MSGVRGWPAARPSYMRKLLSRCLPLSGSGKRASVATHQALIATNATAAAIGPHSTAEEPRAEERRLVTVAASMAMANHRRICVVYDCLFPYTVGGAERWYR